MRAGIATARRRLLGLVMLVVFALILGLCVAIYRKTFADVVPVTLRTDHLGNQLQAQSDVKVRGVIVGEVRDVRSEGNGAVLDLAIQPQYAAVIPANVDAQLLPKTLFGERYVALQVPPNPSPEHLSAGQVIPQDRSTSAIQLETVLDNLLPLLQAVAPQQLSETLGAISAALSGRGGELGATLVKLDHYLRALNPALPDLTADISGLADLGNTYTKAAPDLVAALSELTTTSKTIVDERANLDRTFRSLTTTAGTLRDFLAANRNDIIGLAADSRSTLQVLARYSPEFPCVLAQLTSLVPRVDDAFRDDRLHIDLEITQNRGKYVPGDEPRYLDNRGPRCYQFVGPARQYPPGGPIQDGSHPPPAVLPTSPQAPLTGPRAGPPAGLTSPQAFDPTDLGPANSPGEQELIAELLAPGMGRTPAQVPSWASFLVGGLLRGTEVTLR